MKEWWRKKEEKEKEKERERRKEVKKNEREMNKQTIFFSIFNLYRSKDGTVLFSSHR